MAATDEAAENTETPMSVLGEKARTMDKTMETGTAVDGNIEERSRSEAPEIALAVDSEEKRRQLNGGIRNSSLKLEHIKLR